MLKTVSQLSFTHTFPPTSTSHALCAELIYSPTHTFSHISIQAKSIVCLCFAIFALHSAQAQHTHQCSTPPHTPIQHNNSKQKHRRANENTFTLPIAGASAIHEHVALLFKSRCDLFDVHSVPFAFTIQFSSVCRRERSAQFFIHRFTTRRRCIAFRVVSSRVVYLYVSVCCGFLKGKIPNLAGFADFVCRVLV